MRLDFSTAKPRREHPARPFMKLGLPLLAGTALMAAAVPGCSGREDVSAAAKREAHAPQMRIIRLSAPLDTLVRRMETRHELRDKGRVIEKYWQSTEKKSGWPAFRGVSSVLSLQSGTFRYTHADPVSNRQVTETVNTGLNCALRAVLDTGAHHGIPLQAFAYTDQDTYTVIGGGSSRTAIGDTLVCGLGRFNAILGTATGEKAAGVRWVLDYDPNGQLNVIALAVGGVEGDARSGKPGNILGKYQGGYLAFGWAFDPYHQKPDGDCLLFVLEPGAKVPDLSGLGVKAYEYHYDPHADDHLHMGDLHPGEGEDYHGDRFGWQRD